MALHHEQVKQDICDTGRRLYEQELVVANEGNISVRISDSEVLCTPTQRSKGFLQPQDICTIDLKGDQIGGALKRSSEALVHLEIYRRRDDVRCVIHSHPPHTLAFAATRQPIPAGVLAEVELFLGDVPLSPYATPGTNALAESIAPFIASTNIILMSNHGTVSYDSTLERALWWTEILDKYCRVLILAKNVGELQYLSQHEISELDSQKSQWRIPDN